MEDIGIMTLSAECALAVRREGQRGDHMEDEEIIGLFNARDERALKAVSLKYRALCMSVSNNILQNHEDSTECVNDTFLKAWESIPPAKPKSLPAYLAKIARNTALNRFRAEHREKRGGGTVMQLYEEFGEHLVSPFSVEDQAERREVLEAINRFLHKTNSRGRKIFLRRYWLCESIPELARRFVTTENSISASLSRTRSELIKYLKKRGFEIE